MQVDDAGRVWSASGETLPEETASQLATAPTISAEAAAATALAATVKYEAAQAGTAERPARTPNYGTTPRTCSAPPGPS